MQRDENDGPAAELEDVATALGDALESMAFVSVTPASEAQAPAGPVLRVAIPFGRELRDTLELVAPEEFARLLFANCSGQTDVSQLTPGQAADALVELVNVTCGLYLSRARVSHNAPVMGIPAYGRFESAVWSRFIDEGAVTVDAEGYTLGITLRRAA